MSDEASETENGEDDQAEPAEDATVPPSARVEELSERVEELEAEIEELEATLEDRTDALARAQNDYRSYRKRAEREKQQARQEAQSQLVTVLAEITDDVDRALNADPNENVRKGLEMLNRRIEDELDDIGASRIRPEPGQPFDPERHEVLMTEQTDDQAPDTVVEVLQPGYELEETLVRAARVKVAKAPDE